MENWQEHAKLTKHTPQLKHPGNAQQQGLLPETASQSPRLLQRRMEIPNLIKKEEEIKDSTKCMTNVQLRESLQTESAR